MSEEIKAIRFVNGEVVIGKVINETDNTTEMKNVYQIAPKENNGKMELMLIPYLYYVFDIEAPVVFYKSNMVSSPACVVDSLIKYYKSVTSDILTPGNDSNKLILPKN
jgi:hypothetical protein